MDAAVVGSRARLELVGGDVLEGYIHSVDGNVGKIILQKVTLCGAANKRKLQGLQHYYVKEIKDLEIFEDVDNSLRSNTATAQREKGPRLAKTKEFPRHLQNRPPLKSESLITQMSETVEDEEYGRLTRTDTTGSLKSSDYDSSSDIGEGSGCGKFNVIDMMDEVFREAIDYIRNQSVIGVGLEGVCLGRDGELCWLQISTKDQILLFDILSLGMACFRQGLQDILESGLILKVMHDCRQPSDILYHQFNVELINVFDTQVAAVFIYRMVHHGDYPRYVESLHSLLVQHLDIDLSEIHILRYREKHKKEDQAIWRQRPAPLNILPAASKQVKHLLTLRIKLMELLLKEVNVGTDIFLGYVRDASQEDSKRGPTTRHLLPHAFQNLNTHMDFVRHRYQRPARMYSAGPQKDEHGFDENCEGVKDPYLVVSNDSVWHEGKNHKSPAFRRQSEVDRAKKPTLAGNEESKSLPSSRGASVLNKSSPTKHGHCASRGLPEVRRPTVSTRAGGDAGNTSVTLKSQLLRNVPKESEPERKASSVSVQKELIDYKPAGYYQNDLGKRSRHYHCEDSDLETPIRIGEYSCPEDTDFDDSFSCIPSRESLGRHYQTEHTGSLRESMASKNAENKYVSVDSDDSDSYLPTSKHISSKKEVEALTGSDDKQEPLQNQYFMSPFNSGSDSDGCLSSLSNLQINSPSLSGIGRGICRFTAPPSQSSSQSSLSREPRTSALSLPSPQELLNSFCSPESRAKPSICTPESGDKSILQSMVNSDSAGSSPYARQLSLLKSLSSSKQKASSSSSTFFSDDESSTVSGHHKSLPTSKQKNGPSVTFDGLLNCLASKQY